jgi:hypothetical protein
MRISSRHIPGFRPLILVYSLVIFTLTSAHAQTPETDRVWTSVGSAGTVNLADVGKVFFENGKVQMGHIPIVQGVIKPRRIIGQQIRSAVIRYNVTAVDGLLTTRPHCTSSSDCIGPQLTLRYITAGPRAKVVAKLIEVDLATGAEITRLTMDTTGANINSYRTESIQPACIAQWHFDFQHKAYYVEATLTTLADSIIPTGSVAGIHVIKIGFDSCL